MNMIMWYVSTTMSDVRGSVADKKYLCQYKQIFKQ